MPVRVTILTILFCFEFKKSGDKEKKHIKRTRKLSILFIFLSLSILKYKMGLSDFFGKQHEEVNNASDEHKGSFTHEAIAGAAAYQALKAYNEHCEKEGKPVEHAKAKQLLAGFAAGALDKLIETKGLDYIDKQKAKHKAEQDLHAYYDEEHQ